jgi:hypothetical protein
MDRLFKDWILPVLLKDPWPHIKRMEIKGVGPSSPEELLPNVAFPIARREELREQLPNNAMLVIEGDQERDYEDLEYDYNDVDWQGPYFCA